MAGRGGRARDRQCGTGREPVPPRREPRTPHLRHARLRGGPGLRGGRAGTRGSRTFGRAGLAVELFEFTPGGAGPRLAGVLGAATIRLAEWAVVDAGGAVGATGGTPDQLFLGITTNLGRLF